MENARTSYKELGRRVNLSANAAAERVRRLRQRGVISGFTTIVDAAAAGRELVAIVDVRLRTPADARGFERLAEATEQITDCAHVTGRFDYQLRAACAGAADLDRLIASLKTTGGVGETDTRVVLRTVVRRPGPLPSSASG